MRDILEELTAWSEVGRRFAVARLLQTWGSAPRRPGATMIVDGEGRVAGSVSGGCIEGSVIETARSVLADGVAREITFGVDDEKAWSVGLSCGGEVTVWVEPAWSETAALAWDAIRHAVTAARPVILVTRIKPAPPAMWVLDPAGSEVPGEAGPAPAPAVIESAREAYAARASRVLELDAERFFLHVLPRPDRLLVVGAGHIAVHLVALAREVGFETVVIDPRKTFAQHVRFPVPPDRLLDDWPDQVLPSLNVDEDCYAVLLTHDPKIDDPALYHLLRSPAAYIGALGSRRTHGKRVERLRNAGFSEADVQRIQGPVGLDIGAANPAEIALSILAAVIARKRQKAS
jgi:xanthine dehydrogenase accessory factor